MMNSNNTNTNSNGNSNSTNHNYGLKYITFDEFGRPSWKRPETREESRQFAKDMNKLIKRAIRSYSYSYSYSYQQKTIFHARQTEYVQDKHVSSLFKRVMQAEAELKGIYITRKKKERFSKFYNLIHDHLISLLLSIYRDKVKVIDGWHYMQDIGVYWHNFGNFYQVLKADDSNCKYIVEYRFPTFQNGMVTLCHAYRVVYIDELTSYEQMDELINEARSFHCNMPYERKGYQVVIVARRPAYIQMPDGKFKPYFIYGKGNKAFIFINKEPKIVLEEMLFMLMQLFDAKINGIMLGLGKEWRRRLSIISTGMMMIKDMIIDSMNLQIKPIVRRIMFRLLFLLEAIKTKLKEVSMELLEDARNRLTSMFDYIFNRHYKDPTKRTYSMTMALLRLSKKLDSFTFLMKVTALDTG